MFSLKATYVHDFFLLVFGLYADHDQLFFLVYERVKVNSDSMGPHLWTYRQRVSLEHLGFTLQENKLKEKYPILHEFLHVVGSSFFGDYCTL